MPNFPLLKIIKKKCIKNATFLIFKDIWNQICVNISWNENNNFRISAAHPFVSIARNILSCHSFPVPHEFIFHSTRSVVRIKIPARFVLRANYRAKCYHERFDTRSLVRIHFYHFFFSFRKRGEGGNNKGIRKYYRRKSLAAIMAFELIFFFFSSWIF